MKYLFYSHEIKGFIFSLLEGMVIKGNLANHILTDWNIIYYLLIYSELPHRQLEIRLLLHCPILLSELPHRQLEIRARALQHNLLDELPNRQLELGQEESNNIVLN
ncbi:hypothetical protein CJF42_16155 [Pseudoalteromonas sp. NBT06-2]|nr:hypothetical protein CJF42_16155 [Pseudoalteromonas sp. NBT06-2]